MRLIPPSSSRQYSIILSGGCRILGQGFRTLRSFFGKVARKLQFPFAQEGCHEKMVPWYKKHFDGNLIADEIADILSVPYR